MLAIARHRTGPSPAAVPTHNDVAVEEDGERVDEGLVDAGVVEVEELLQLALERRDALGGVIAVLPSAGAAAAAGGAPAGAAGRRRRRRSPAPP